MVNNNTMIRLLSMLSVVCAFQPRNSPKLAPSDCSRRHLADQLLIAGAMPFSSVLTIAGCKSINPTTPIMMRRGA